MIYTLDAQYCADDIEKLQDYNKRYHYLHSKHFTFCLALAKQQAVSSRVRFVVKIGSDTELNYLSFELPRYTMLYGCGCNLDKYDILNEIMK